MKSMIRKTTLREIKQSFGRYLAIFAIVALGVGFFAGLKVAKEAMVYSVDQYLKETEFYDLRLLSTLGFEKKDVEAFGNEEDVKAAEGAVSADVLYISQDGNEGVVKVHSITNDINKLVVKAGRMPENALECVVDSNLYTEEAIGTTITFSENNSEETKDLFPQMKYTIVGIVQSPYYMNFERGNTSIGNGKISGFLYLPEDAFDCNYYTEVFIKLHQDLQIYSADYEDYMETASDTWDTICEERVNKRYQEILEDAQRELAAAGKEDVGKELLGIEEPEYYVLTRDTNVGYVCFESDSSIVEGIANVFPIFFFLVAALICITTMNRMVEEQRTQIGVLKALGYGEGTIMGKYMFYSGSGAVCGCILGFFAGTYVFPLVIWKTYDIMYNTCELSYVFNGGILAVSLVVSLLCSIGTTWLSCRYELFSAAAKLMRPKAPKAGKRILLEKIPFLWSRLKFLQKVSIRNLFRYKKRFFMMVIGISGCTALLVTGFGIKDSIADVAGQQFEEIQIFDLNISLKEEMDTDTDEENSFTRLLETWGDGYCQVHESSMDVVGTDETKTVNLVIMKDDEQIGDYVSLHTAQNEAVAYPQKDEAVISNSVADLFHLKTGDSITLRDNEYKEIELKVSGIFENFVYNYVYINRETYMEHYETEPEYKTLYMNVKDGKDIHEASAALMDYDRVSAVTVNADTMERFDTMMKSLNYIVLLIIICAGSLAFIVLYNLTNINITERIREIATVKVLGFYRNETASYVFRENIVLTAIGALLGLGLGRLLHAFVMSQIQIDMVSFDVHVKPASYVYSLLFTFGFTVIVNLFMSYKLEKIDMAESLKSVD